MKRLARFYLHPLCRARYENEKGDVDACISSDIVDNHGQRKSRRLSDEGDIIKTMPA